MRYILFILFALPLILSGQNQRVFTGKCAISQTGSGSGYWQVSLTNFNDPGGQYDATEIAANDYLYFSDGGTPYSLRITFVVSASGSDAVIRVSNVGVTGIGSVPTSSSAFVSRRTINLGLTPFVANLTGNDNQLQQEAVWAKLDTLIYRIDTTLQGGGASATNLGVSGTSSPLTLTSSTGNDVAIIAGTNVTLSGTSNSLTINATGDGQGVTAVTASSPLSSSGGNTPNISLTGVIPIANGGTGSSTKSWWDLTTDQTSLGIKKTTGLLTGTGTQLPGMNFGTTSATIRGLKGGTSTFTTESAWQDWDGLLHEAGILTAGTQRHRIIATGSDVSNRAGFIEFWTRAEGANRNTVQALELGAYSTASNNSRGYITVGGASFLPSLEGSITTGDRGLTINGSGEPFRLAYEAGLGLTVRSLPFGPNDWIQANAAGWVQSSDSTLKTNIQQVQMTPAQIRNLKAYTYNWKIGGFADVGIIAQTLKNDTLFSRALRGTEGIRLGVNGLSVAALAVAAANELQLQVDRIICGNSESIASASNLELPTDKNVVMVSGTTGISGISSSGRSAGAEITLIFTESLTVTDSAVSTGSYKSINLAGSSNFSATADDTLTLVYDGTKWLEKSRSVN